MKGSFMPLLIICRFYVRQKNELRSKKLRPRRSHGKKSEVKMFSKRGFQNVRRLWFSMIINVKVMATFASHFGSLAHKFEWSWFPSHGVCRIGNLRFPISKFIIFVFQAACTAKQRITVKFSSPLRSLAPYLWVATLLNSRPRRLGSIWRGLNIRSTSMKTFPASGEFL